MKAAPVLLFTYNRPEHSRQTIAALANNELAAETPLIIHSDGPRGPHDRDTISTLRQELRQTRGFASLSLIEQKTNHGLARSIIDGVSSALTHHDRVIVLEDDMITSRYFLRYMNEALAMYQNDDQVASIHAYSYPVTTPLPETFFLKGADCWGWATWSNMWQLFREDGRQLLNELKARDQLARFDFFGSYPYSRMLRRQIAGKNDSWAIRWYASTLLANRLCLYPGRSLLHNIGNDDSGEHSHARSKFDTQLASQPIKLQHLPLQESPQALASYARFLSQSNPGISASIHRHLRRWLRMDKP